MQKGFLKFYCEKMVFTARKVAILPQKQKIRTLNSFLFFMQFFVYF